MVGSAIAPLAAVVCFLLAALAYVHVSRGEAWFGAAGVAILAGVLAARGLRAGHWPLTSEYEFILAFALSTALAAILLSARKSAHSALVQAAAMLLAAGMVAYASLVMPDSRRLLQSLPPALRSGWLPLHVGMAALAYGALAVAGTAGLVWLLREADRPRLERLLDQAVAAGYPLLTLALFLGMIWAQVAWGRYWSWDLKEVWTLVIWLVYTLYWHLRRRRHWPGRRIAWLALIGLGLVLFALLSTGWLARTVALDNLPL
jgi:ABC-type transport system involved in cytochrome c biogenesis permease subunit